MVFKQFENEKNYTQKVPLVNELLMPNREILTSLLGLFSVIK